MFAIQRGSVLIWGVDGVVTSYGAPSPFRLKAAACGAGRWLERLQRVFVSGASASSLTWTEETRSFFGAGTLGQSAIRAAP